MTDPAPSLGLATAGGVATLTLSRPNKRNAYNKAMLRELGEHLTRIAADDAVRVLVLRAQGRHFCAGAEIGADDSAEPGPTIAEVCGALDTLPKPTLALVQGACIGGGVALVACCDVVMAARDAVFALPEVRLGLVPGPLIPVFIAAFGPRAARRLLLSGERFDAGEALRLGLVHEVCDAENAEATAAHLTGELLQAAPLAAAEIKVLLRRLSGVPVTPGLLAELQAQFGASADSAEAQEGRAAFRDKRRPRWVRDS
jgi:methylglutaconyl-CoA hydratase